MPAISLSVVIPVFNEEASIQSVIAEHAQALEKLAPHLFDWEILCLDDASTDKTVEILQACALNNSRLRILRNALNQGISPSFMRLFHEARGQFIYLTAGDGQWPAENLSRLFNARQETGADLIVGVRQERDKVYGFMRRLMSYGFNYLAKVFFNIDAQDVNGIKLGRRAIFTAPVKSKSFLSEIERIAAAQSAGYKIGYAPVIFLPRLHGSPKGAKIANVAGTFVDFIKYYLIKNRT